MKSKEIKRKISSLLFSCNITKTSNEMNDSSQQKITNSDHFSLSRVYDNLFHFIGGSFIKHTAKNFIIYIRNVKRPMGGLISEVFFHKSKHGYISLRLAENLEFLPVISPQWCSCSMGYW